MQVSKELEKEEHELGEHRYHPRGKRPETPVIDDVRRAAEQLEMPGRDLIWEIHAYAERNLLTHNNIKHLINECDWRRVAERTCLDLAVLHRVYPGRGKDQIEMRKTIKRFQANYFQYVTRNNNGEIAYEINARARFLSERRNKRILAGNISQLIYNKD